MNTIRKLSLTMAIVTTVALTACSRNDDPPDAGAGGGAGGTVAVEVPASAGTSASNFIDFLLAMASTETSEPLSIGDGFAVPAEEASDPRPLT